MKKFPHNAIRRSTLSNRVAKGVTAVVGTAMFAPAAFAGALADAATGGMDKAELLLIGAAILGLCGVVAMIKAGKRTTN